jgi:hypothetical protein
MRVLTRRLAAALLLAALPAAAAAQVPGVPVRTVGLPRGLSVAADVGMPNAASGLDASYAASAGLGLGLLGVTVSVARTGREGADALTTAGALANLRLIGGPLVPFFAVLQAGAARWTTGTTIEGGDLTVTSVPIGLGLGWTIASPVVSLKPWLAPRLQWTRHAEDGPFGSAVSTTDPAISGGVDLGFINGIALRGMYDRILNDGIDVSTWSVGVGYSLRIGR